MKMTYRKPLATGFALAAGNLLMTTSAYAQCVSAVSFNGGGPPSISATEASTAQALEIIQRRKDEAVAEAENIQLASAESVAAADGTVQAETGGGGGGGGGGAAAAGPKPKPQPLAYKPKKSAASGPEDVEYTGQETYGGGAAVRGSWSLGYADYERNGDVNIGLRDSQPVNNPGLVLTDDEVNVTAKQKSYGTLSGFDWTYLQNGPVLKGHQFGIFAGTNRIDTDYSDGLFSTFEFFDNAGNPTPFGGEQIFERTNAKDKVESVTFGLFGAYFHDKFSADLAVKADIGSLESSHVLSRFRAGCGGLAVVAPFRSGETDFVDYTIASNVAQRYQMSGSSWFEPTAGFRFSYTTFNSQTGTINLGADDGHTLRLQGGFRFGDVWISPHRHVWTTTFTGLVYSDVLIDGYVATVAIGAPGGAGLQAGTADAASLNDEGKVRVSGEVSSVVDIGNGYSLVGQVEVRGGEEYFGVGGRLGFRYEW